MTDKLPIDKAVEEFDLRHFRKSILREHIEREATTDYGQHVAATFTLHHDLWTAIRATMTIHEVCDNGLMLLEYALAQTVVHCAILCGDWPDDLIQLQHADPEFATAYREALIALDKRARGSD